ncbi:MAG TPA: penicillin-binding protein 1A [Devosia sp.]|nr:penicillin-binding protein 1A [Devosia sp.]
MIRLLGWLFSLACLFFLCTVGAAAVYLQALTRDLPDYTVLKDYHPLLTTRVHAADGTLLAEYAKERRLFQPIETIPPLVADAFISAEDKDFYNHHGISPDGILRAVRDDVLHYLSGDRGPLVGASTITQQVAKNFFLTPDQSTERKIREAILAVRIDSTFSKDKILELYLNEIFMGSLNGEIYGVTSAALSYFNKSLYQLDLSEIAYLAGLPKGPNNYNPFRYPKAAVERRNYVLDQMLAKGYISKAQHDAAEAEALDVTPRASGVQLYSAEYFTEEVRRQLAQLYGEDQLYTGGLSVRTTLDPKMQEEARKALMDGLIAYDRNAGFRKPVASIDISGGDWATPLYKIAPLSDVPEWTLAVVLSTDKAGAEIGLRPGSDAAGKMLPGKTTGTLANADSKWVRKGVSAVLKPGDVVYVSPVEDKPGNWQVQQLPEIEGALVAMDPRTGRVEAMVGGFSYAESQFNRATQAMRQPGSSFKPIVYSAALDNGYTPASIELDAPLEIKNADGTVWKPENYEQDFLGPSTLRRGIELSRNVMTVRLAQDIGMPLIADYAKKFGIYDNLMPVLAMALGAGETTDFKMTAAYATIANGGKQIVPTLIDRVQDRYGKTIYRHDQRICDGCNATSWSNQPEPLLIDNGQQVLDPMTAYQITSMMEGVVQRGTGTYAKRLNRPVAGKTGTSSDFKDAWFIGFTPQLVCGVYIGFDRPRSIGNGQTGGAIAVPVFTDFMQAALAGQPPTPFNMPAGMDAKWIDPKTGVEADQGQQAILEAFKPGTGPNLPTSIIGLGSDDGTDYGNGDFEVGDFGNGSSQGGSAQDGSFQDGNFPAGNAARVRRAQPFDNSGSRYQDLPPPSLTDNSGGRGGLF